MEITKDSLLEAYSGRLGNIDGLEQQTNEAQQKKDKPERTRVPNISDIVSTSEANVFEQSAKNEIYSVDIQRERIQSEIELNKARENATFEEKSEANKFVYLGNTQIGSLVAGKPKAEEYKRDEEWIKIHQTDNGSIRDLVMKHNGNIEDYKDILSSGSEQEQTDRIAFFLDKKIKENFIQQHLNPAEQKWAYMLTVGDADAGLSLATMGIGSILGGASTATRLSLALTSAVVSGSKPYMVDSAFNQNQNSRDLFAHAGFASFIEFGGTYIGTPAFKQASKQPINDTVLLLEYNKNGAKVFSDSPIEVMLGKQSATIDERLANFGIVPKPPTATNKYDIVLSGSQAVDTPLIELTQYAKGVEEGLIKPISQESRIILDEYKASKLIDNEVKTTIETTTKELPLATKSMKAEDKLFQEVEELNARQVAIETKGKSSNQLIQYFREIKQSLQNYIKETPSILKADSEFLKHLNNKDYESALLRAEELTSTKSIQSVADAQREARMAKEADAVIELPTQLKTHENIINGIRKTLNDTLKEFNRIGFDATLSSMSNSLKNVNKLLEDTASFIMANKGNKQLIAKTMAETKIEIDSFMKGLKDLGFSSKIQKEMSNRANKMLDVFEEGSMLAKEEGILLKRDGEFFKLGNKKIPIAIAIGALGTTSGFAFEGDGSSGNASVFNLQSLIVLGAVVAGLYGGYTGYKLLSQANKAVTGGMEGIGVIERLAMIRKQAILKINDDFGFARTSFTETYRPLFDYAEKFNDVKMKDLLKAMLNDPMVGNSMVAEWSKKRIFNTTMGKYIETETKAYSEWLKEVYPDSIFQKVKDLLIETKQKRDFRELVTMAREGKLDETIKGNSTINRVAKETQKHYDDIQQMALELGVEGASSAGRVKNYVNRVMASNSGNFLRGLDDASLAKVKEMFIGMYKSAIGEGAVVHSKLFKDIENVFSKFKDIDDFKLFVKEKEAVFKKLMDSDATFKEAFEDMLKAKDLTEAKVKFKSMANELDIMAGEDKITEKIGQYIEDMKSHTIAGDLSDIAKQLKRRIPLDMSKFKEIEVVSASGEKAIMNIKDIFERDSHALMVQYAHQMSGRIALKQAGYDVSEAKIIIDKIKDSKIKARMENALNATIGVPLFEIANDVKYAVNAVSNISTASAMLFVSTSFAAEFGMLIGRLAINGRERQAVLSEITNIIKGHGADSCLHEFIRKNFGLSNGMEISNMGGRLDADLTEVGQAQAKVANMAGKAVGDYAKWTRDTVYHKLGLLKLSDILESTNAIANMQRLKDVASGKKVLQEYQLRKFGITQKELDLANKYMEYNAQGYIKTPKWADMTMEEQMRFNGVIRAMNQVGAQQSTLGGTPMYLMDNPLGAAFGRLLGYSVNSFANIGLHQLNGLKNLNLENFIQMTGLYTGAYVGMNLRDAMKGKTRTDEDYHKYAIMQMPQLAPVSLIHSFSSPSFIGSLNTGEKAISGMSNMMFGASQ